MAQVIFLPESFLSNLSLLKFVHVWEVNKRNKDWTSNSSSMKYIVRISQIIQAKMWFHFCMSQQPKSQSGKQNSVFQVWSSTLLQIPALYPSTLPDIYYRAEGEIFFFVYFTSSSLLSDNSNLTLKSTDYFLCTQYAVWTSFPWAVLTSSGDTE